MSIVRKLERALRGEVDARTAALEVVRRTKVSLVHKRERASIGQDASLTPKLRAPLAALSPADLVSHFRNRTQPKFLPGFISSPELSPQHREFWPRQTVELFTAAERIL